MAKKQQKTEAAVEIDSQKTATDNIISTVQITTSSPAIRPRITRVTYKPIPRFKNGCPNC
jgi:hypothetical protein